MHDMKARSPLLRPFTAFKVVDGFKYARSAQIEISDLPRYALTICFLTMLAGCGEPQTSIGTLEGAAQKSAIKAHTDRAQSWMLPEAKVADLLYVGDGTYPFYVNVYNYKTDKLLGQLSGFSFYEATGMCVDAKGDIWITSDYTSQVVEYAHGGVTPLQTLSTDGTSTGCSVSASGDLAVTNYATPSGYGDIQVWKNASGIPTSYSDPNACYLLWPAGYDNKGNLYVESQGYVCELPAGGSSLKPIAFDRTIYYPSSVMWDGKYITLSDQRYNNGYYTSIYRAVRTPSGGLKTVGVTLLSYSHSLRAPVNQPFFVGKKNTPINNRESKAVIGNLSGYSTTWIEYYHYKSGNAFKSFVSFPVTTGQGVSLASSHNQ